MSDLYVQYGCGLCAPDCWLNFDASPTLRLQRIPGLSVLARRVGPVFPPAARVGDAVKGLPVPRGSCAGVYCSHVLEYLALEECRAALASTFSILKPGGIFRLAMPDLHICATDYLANPDPQAALGFMQNTLLGQATRPRGFLNFLRGWNGPLQPPLDVGLPGDGAGASEGRFRQDSQSVVWRFGGSPLRSRRGAIPLGSCSGHSVFASVLISTRFAG